MSRFDERLQAARYKFTDVVRSRRDQSEPSLREYEPSPDVDSFAASIRRRRIEILWHLTAETATLFAHSQLSFGGDEFNAYLRQMATYVRDGPSKHATKSMARLLFDIRDFVNARFPEITIAHRDAYDRETERWKFANRFDGCIYWDPKPDIVAECVLDVSGKRYGLDGADFIRFVEHADSDAALLQSAPVLEYHLVQRYLHDELHGYGVYDSLARQVTTTIKQCLEL